MNKSLAIFGGSYLLSLKQPTLAQAGTAPSGPAGGAPGFEAAKGASLFADKCAACHGAEGKGVPGTFPPLAGDPVVNAADPTAHITTILHGLGGKELNGQKYEAEMPPFADQLSNQEIADIIDHERSSWGNRGALIIAADVAATRANKPLQKAAAQAPQTQAQAAPFDTTEGSKQFADNCAICHGPDGKGVPGTFPSSPITPSSMPTIPPAWYVATSWSVPPDYAKTPTYSTPMNPFE